jgi:hypothetical protein
MDGQTEAIAQATFEPQANESGSAKPSILHRRCQQVIGYRVENALPSAYSMW